MGTVRVSQLVDFVSFRILAAHLMKTAVSSGLFTQLFTFLFPFCLFLRTIILHTGDIQQILFKLNWTVANWIMKHCMLNYPKNLSAALAPANLTVPSFTCVENNELQTTPITDSHTQLQIRVIMTLCCSTQSHCWRMDKEKLLMLLLLLLLYMGTTPNCAQGLFLVLCLIFTLGGPCVMPEFE